MYKPRNLCLIVFALFAMTLFSACAGAVTGPDDPNDKETVEYYDYTITYARPSGSIVRPDMGDPTGPAIVLKNGNKQLPGFTKISDYEFTAQIVGVPTHLKKEKNLPSNYIYVVDPKRWIDMWSESNGQLWGRPFSVGDIFKLKNNKTGLELVLNNIIVNSILLPYCPNGCDPQVAQFWTIKGGTIVNVWPYQ